MVVALGPGKFYGSSLPRPRYYKPNEERVDPPLPVLDPLLSWANEAHWSMGGLSFKRLRLQGKIEGNIQKLKKEKEKISKNGNHNQSSTPISELEGKSSVNGGNRGKKRASEEDSPPPAPISKKRRQRTMLVDEDQDDDGSDGEEVERDNEGVKRKRRRLVRKLGDDFEMVATENGGSQEGVLKGVASRTRSRRSMVLVEEEEEESEDREISKVGKAGKRSERKGSVSPEWVSWNNGEKGSASPVSATRSSPRLKKKCS